eukprot:GHVS01029768.1.p1 GENE.GHVS01029768.1~~GHVS01029768.1.p1  ORF type:complete len:131 (+),score=25.00 GHVS01029768.1:164-556(+)
MTSNSADTRRNHALSTERIEPTDPQIKLHYEQFKHDITKQALIILREIVPKKIIYFNKLVSVSADPGSVLHSTDLDKAFAKFPSHEVLEVEGEPSSKKHKVTYNLAATTATTTTTTSTIAVPSYKVGKEL